MRKLVASGAIAASVLAGASPALASPNGSGVKGENCVTVDESRSLPGGGSVSTGRHVVCETHDVSGSGASASLGYSGTAPSADPGDPLGLLPIDGAGDPGVPQPDLAEVLDTVCGIRDREWRDAGDPTAYADLYRRVVNCLGFSVYENTVCPRPGESNLECWATDYLVGDYVGNYLIDWVDGHVPLPPAGKDLAQGLIDEVVDATNGEGSEPPQPPMPGQPPMPPRPPVPGIPGIPGIPQGPAPELPDVQDMIQDLVDELTAQADGMETPEAQDVLDMVGAAAEEAGREVDHAVDEAWKQAYDGASNGSGRAFDAVEIATRTAESAIRDVRRQAEDAVERAKRESGHGDKVDQAKQLADDLVSRTTTYVNDRVNFLRSQAGL